MEKDDDDVVIKNQQQQVQEEEESRSSSSSSSKMEFSKFRCINCGCKIKMLFVQYSPGNIRLMKCENCHVIADEYIECEIMILLIDLILHKRKAYRHLLYNAPGLHPLHFQGILWKSALFYLLLDGYRTLLLTEDLDLSLSSFSSVWICGKMLMDVFLVNFAFIGVLLLASRMLLTSSSEVTRYKDLILAIIISSYFKIFLIAMMVWDFPSSVLFIIDILVLSSNAVALKVVTESRMTSRCIWVCLVAHAVKFSFCSSQWWKDGGALLT